MIQLVGGKTTRDWFAGGHAGTIKTCLILLQPALIFVNAPSLASQAIRYGAR